MESFIVHYYRYDEDYSGWTLWTWDNLTQQNSKEIKYYKINEAGISFQVNRKDYGTGMEIGLLPKYKEWENKDAPDRIYRPQMGPEIWILEGDRKLYNQKPDIRPAVQTAYLDGADEIIIVLTHRVEKADIKPENIYLKNNNGDIRSGVKQIQFIPDNISPSKILKVFLTETLDIAHEPVGQYKIIVEGFNTGQLLLRKILDLTEFNADIELGALYSTPETIFRIFAPTASKLILNLYNEPVGSKGKKYPMRYSKNGIWELTLRGDLINKYYTYQVDGSDPRFRPDIELIDPYSRANTAHAGRGIIIQDQTMIAERPNFDISESIIYELHIRDITIDDNSGVRHKGKYLGLSERGTKYPGRPDISTALEHIIELGVNVVQIMPFQDFENDEFSQDYNWGYMPVHFNSPDGWFATERYSSKRVMETKKMIDAFHRNGIKVIMDVVYNHTAENHESKIFSFNGLVPGYYYRLRDDGLFWNGSGTGNEFRSEAFMARKFIIDSVKYWVNEYKIDGFRFDLMGLIDLKTMEEIVKELHAIDSNIFIYGEPWAGGDTPIRKTEKGMQRNKGFSVFNNHFRDALKGNVFNAEHGYVQNGSRLAAVKRGILGSITDFTEHPIESINYIECHDNQSYWDRLVYTTRQDRNITDGDRIKMNKIGVVILFTSQGIPFIQCGQEFLRTKGGDDNSYNKPDIINKVRWEWKIKYNDIYEYYKGLITLRKNHPMLRFKRQADVLANVKFLDDDLQLPLPANCLGYQITRGNSGDEWNIILVLVNPNPQSVNMVIPEGDWIIVVNDKEAGSIPVKTGSSIISGGKVELPERSAMVLYRC